MQSEGPLNLLQGKCSTAVMLQLNTFSYCFGDCGSPLELTQEDQQPSRIIWTVAWRDASGWENWHNWDSSPWRS